MTGSRLRTAAVTAPVLVSLLVLLVSGLARPHLIEPGPGPDVYRWAVGTVGAGSVAALTLAAARSRGRLRLSWLGIAVTAAAWTLAVLGELLGWNSWLDWVGLRALAGVAGAAGLLAAPGVRRTAREWGLVVLDGWLVGGSVLVIGWVALAHTGSPLTAAAVADRPMLRWVPVDLLFASVTAGLAMRTDRATRVPVLLMVLVSLLAVTGDTSWALTGLPEFPVVQWLIMMFALGGTTISHRLDLWQVAPASLSPPRLIRWSQLAVVPGLAAAVTSAGDPVVATVALTVVLVMAAEIVLVSRQNNDLWSTLDSQARRLDQLVSESRDAIVQVGDGGTIEFANEAVADVLGYGPPAVLGRNGAGFIHPDDRACLFAEVARLGADRTAVRVSSRFRHRDGGWRYLEATVSRRSNGVPGYTLLARDVGDRVRLEAELRRLASTDALTGLCNRFGFLAVLDERLSAGPAAVLFIDLDGFKAVNDLYGHGAGDRLLREVAAALRTELKPDDVAARLGGDEFAVLTGSRDREGAEALALRVADRLRRLPSDAGGRTGASIGVAVGQATDAESLLGDADLAMYQAKTAGGGRRIAFEPAMREQLNERARVHAALERARDGEGLLLDMQPIVAIADGRWIGFEALLRWQDGPNTRLPESFLPMAEETGLIVPIGAWALRASLDWLATYPDPNAGISVNLAGRQVAEAGLVDLVATELERSGVAPNRLTLEITEQTAVQDLERAGASLQPLRALGVHVSLDDFGTGFSSLGYLAQLPVDELKIDRRFVAGLGRRDQDDVLVAAVTGLAADLGLRLVAEGVETAQQATALLARGCTLGQGYRFGAPTPSGQIRPQLTARAPLTA